MATFTTISLDKARRSALPPRRAMQEQYREYVRSLAPDGAGRLDRESDDRPITERARLKAAAKTEGINLEIRRRGNAIVFWRTEEAPTPRRRAASGNGR